MAFGENLKDFRENYLHKSQTELAKKLGISQQQVAKMENNTSTPSLRVLELLAENTQIDLHWLITGRGDVCVNDNDAVAVNVLKTENEKLRNEVIDLYRKLNNK